MLSKKDKIRLLMELRPAMEGFAGIPQETRLLFAAFSRMEGIEATGLLNHGIRKLKPGIPTSRKFQSGDIHRKYDMLSRHVTSHTEFGPSNPLQRVIGFSERKLRSAILGATTTLGISQKITNFEGRHFEDFIWRKLFAKTLPVSDFDSVVNAKYAVLTAPWHDMHSVGMNPLFLSQYPKISSGNYDVLLSQTPWPGRVHTSTQLVVRYHDAIPMFLPHTIPNTAFHQASHYLALKENVKRGVFVCTTEAVRKDLLCVFPNVEDRSVVIHDIVSHNYFLENVQEAYIPEIVRSRLMPETEPTFLTAREKTAFYSKHLDPQRLKYILMVSTIEPRKNHTRIISAWEMLRQSTMPELKLILVGELGWDYTLIRAVMRSWQERGELFHLARVPSPDLKRLYAAAQVVVCPSLGEGFDLSGIEAMLSGGVVAASDIPVHREVYGESCEYFNPHSTSQAAEAIERLINKQDSHWLELRERGLRQAQQYKRENIAPKWEVFFDSIKCGTFSRDRRVHFAAVDRRRDFERGSASKDVSKQPRKLIPSE